MKKTETKIIPAVKAKPAKKKEVVKIYCDFCNATLPDHGSYGWYPRCTLCGRDTCRKHNHPDPHEYGDYPDWFCDICLDLRYNVYQNDYLEMVGRHEKEEEKFMKMLKEKSLESPIS